MAEVPHSLAGVLRAAQEHGVGALGGTERQLIEGDALSASSEDTGPGGLGEPESAHYATRDITAGGLGAGKGSHMLRSTGYASHAESKGPAVRKQCCL